MRRVIDAAKAVAIPMDREVIHVIPQEYIIDDQDGIREPLGMSGVRLEAKIHIVTAAVTSAQNIVKCANKAGLNVMDIVLEPLASAEAVLADDERELGVCLIDIGGGTTDIAVFADGAIKHTCVLGLGGYHVTNDIAVGLRTPFEEAERIKKRFGAASARLLGSDDVITVPSVGGRRPREVSRKILCEIIEPRIDEILTLSRQEIVKAGLEDQIPSGVVLTGGCAALAGIGELAEEIFEAPVRIGQPVARRRAAGRGAEPDVRDRRRPRALRRRRRRRGAACRASGSATSRSSGGCGSACATGSTGSSTERARRRTSSGGGDHEIATFRRNQALEHGKKWR